MKIKFNQFLTNLKIKVDYTSIKKGVLKGLQIPMLPYNVNKFYNYPIIRILRVIGGFITVLVLTKNHVNFTDPSKLILMIIALIHLTQIVIISIIKVIYGLNKILKHPENFEVRNLPLSGYRYSRQIANLIYCWKMSCTAMGGGVGLIGGGAVIDDVLDSTGYGKVFIPFLGRVVKFMIGTTQIENPVQDYDDVTKNLN